MIDNLMMYGLSRQEASIYLCLLKNAELTGYEVAKITGVSRSNVYTALNSLVESGAAYVAEGNPSKYVAVELEEFCDNHMRQLQRVKEYLLQNRPNPVQSSDGYITIEGNRHICDKIHHMLQTATKRIYFSAESSFLNQWEEEIRSLVEKKIKVVFISEDYPQFAKEDEDIKQGLVFYRGLENREKKEQVGLIIDSEFVLTGEVAGTGRDTCLYSAQKNFVTVFKDAMRNEIELIQIKGKAREE